MNVQMIKIRGARQHNLKNIDVDIPRNKLVVITGLSGSGKSTLAFDTLYAEGRRRYVESLSVYARQFLERMEKPEVDLIEGLSPAIAVEQKAAAHNPRSTVGTVTEIFDYIRLLYARIGVPHCYICGKPITPESIDQLIDRVMALEEKTKIVILSPVVKNRKGSHEAVLNKLKKEGFSRVRIDSEIREIENAGKLKKEKAHTIDVVIDRLIMKNGIRNRLADSLELALSQSEGLVEIHIPGGESFLFAEKASCIACGVSYPEFKPAHFSFNSPEGACPKCDGMGTIRKLDPDLIVPDRNLSLREGAVVPWAKKKSLHFLEFLDSLAGHYGVDIYTPFKELPDHFKHVLFYGSGAENLRLPVMDKSGESIKNAPFEGVIKQLERFLSEMDSDHAGKEFQRYMSYQPCPECHGARLNVASRSVKINGRSIPEVASMPIPACRTFFQTIEATLSHKDSLIAKKITSEIQDRIRFLENVGLSYLTIDRSAATLSGGESQRIRLATQIGSKLTGVLYVLDEPSIGLHQRDNRLLLSALFTMRDFGNTILVVEHDEETILEADHILDLGPGAGVKGGEIVFSGTAGRLLECQESLTGQYLSGAKRIEIPHRRRPACGLHLAVEGAGANNLKNIDVAFPLGCFICVTGVSGSGKSSLVIETLYKILMRKKYRSHHPSGECKKIAGIEHIDKVIHIDQSPIGKTPRSNPGTYTGLFSNVREIFAKTPEARVRGYKSGRFSFNMKGGRCEACKGDGMIKIEMHFLPDIYVPCDVCKGARYNRETLEIKYRGKNIVDVLDMTINQAIPFFEKIAAIRIKLETLAYVGLGYIKIGQPGTTLSGGEAQRVKLARELSKKGTGSTLYILDEPTTGLHIEDVKKLLDVLDKLVDLGNTVVVIEHNLDVIKCADYIIDLGPEGGEDGGYVVGVGTPEEIARNEQSYTGRFLKKRLAL